MSLNDQISDALTCIRNAQKAGHEAVSIKSNKMLESILEILKNEGFIESFQKENDKMKKKAVITLKYHKGAPVIQGIRKISTPGRRVYVSWKNIKPVLNNIGINILSTPKGVITGKEAKFQHVGGEYICEVW
ncbi:MAG: 30S ribosomal protein S8 [Spirochaetia bacterium]|nr:30S ribosomal protein S8 [Spirochaetia bacterium]